MKHVLQLVIVTVLLPALAACVSCRDGVFAGGYGDTTTGAGNFPPDTTTCDMSCIGATRNTCGCTPSCVCWSNPDHAK